MALVHKSKKITHCLTATKHYMRGLFTTLSHMYEEGVQTDLTLVAANGVPISVHKIMLIGCSSFVRDMLPKEPICDCESLSIYLPDFGEATIKNLLSIIYTGICPADSSTTDLTSLIETLKIDIKNLETSDVQGIALGEDHFELEEETFDNHEDGDTTPSPLDGQQDDDDDDEMLEVTPEVQMFFGNHFMAGGDEDETSRDQRHEGESQPAVVEKVNGSDLNGEGHGSQKGYYCRLCGHTAPNGASLFAHLLYPHYAHLWRTEIPHRAAKYDCKSCPYQTSKRQHFVMHVARVHDDLRKKMETLGENLEILDNLTPKTQTTNKELIASVIAKPRLTDDAFADDSIQSPFTRDDGMDSPPSKSNYSPSTKDMLTQSQKELIESFSPQKAAAAMAAFSSSQAMVAAATAAALGDAASAYGLLPNRFPRGFKPWVKCRLCGKGWKGKDNFFTHLVSTHFKYLWAAEVPKHAEMFQCHVGSCNYQSKYRYNFLFHLAGKHKQLKQKLAQAGIPLDVLVPVESDGSEFEGNMSNANATIAGANVLVEALKRSKLMFHQQSTNNQQRRLQDGMLSPNMMKLSGMTKSKPQSPTSSGTNNTRLVCRVCHKVSLNHTCHRQHVVGKHFQEFWSHHSPDHMGIFHCHHSTCTYKTPNRSVFVIHLAYVHSELKTKLIESGKDPNCATPDVYGKRKYRRETYDNTLHTPGDEPGQATTSTPVAVNNIPPTREEEDRTKYRCKLCQALSHHYRVMTEHLAIYHFGHIWDDPSDANPFAVPEAGPFNCQLCSFGTSSRQNFICHSVVKHDILKQVMAHHYDDKTVDDLIEVEGDENGDLSDLKIDEEEGDDEEDDEEYNDGSEPSGW